MQLTLTINGKPWTGEVDDRTTLVHLVREHVGLTGTHIGCEQGACGACTVLLDDQPVRGCLVLAAQAQSCSVGTIEGLSSADHLSPLQEASTAPPSSADSAPPGFLITAHALLRKGDRLTRDQIREELAGNICRCTGYAAIVDAVYPMPRFTLTDRASLVQGCGQFLTDVPIDDALEVAFARSPALARILNVRIPDGRGFSGADLSRDLRPLRVDGAGLAACDWYRLAVDRVRYVGEPVAIVWAENRYVAEDLEEQVELDYEELGVGTPLHEAIPDGVYVELNFVNGDVNEAFAGADHVFERTFSNSRVSAMPMEGRGVIASWDGRRLTVWTSTQIPDIVRDALSVALSLDKGAVRVLVPDVGGGFGQKAHVFAEEIAVAAAAKRLRRTLRWVEDRRELLIAGSHARGTEVTVRVAVTRNGRLLAADQTILHDAGAYPIYPQSPLGETITCAFGMFGPYRMDAIRIAAKAVASNRCPAGVHRGVGNLAAVHATERMMDEIGAALQLDPFEIRRRNVIPSLPAVTASGGDVGSGDYHALLDKLEKASDFKQLRVAQRKA